MSATPELLATLRTAQPVWLLELDLPAGTSRYSSVGAASLSLGQYEGRVVEGGWGRIRRAPSDERSGSFSNASTTVTIDDADRTFARVVEGADGDDVEGSAARIKVAAVGLAASLWSTRFVGTLERWQWSGTTVTLTLRPRDLPFVRRVPMAGWVLSPGVWPNAAAGLHGEIAPIVYGTLDSAPFTNLGFVPCLLIDTTGTKRHLVSARRVTVSRVFVDGIEQASGWTASTITRAGREWTVIDWDADPGDDVSVVADVVGYEDVGDGSGDVIANPILQLKHLLINWYFSDEKTGAWATSSSYVDDTSFAALAAHFDAYVSARRIATSVDGATLIAEWALSHHLRTFWTADGKLGVGVEDPTLLDIYFDSPWLRPEAFDEELFDYERTDRNRVTRLTSSYVYDPSAEAYLFVSDIAEPTKDESREDFAMRWGPAS